MWNPFAKNKLSTGGLNNSNMGMLQAMAMKKMAKMSSQEKNKMMQEAMKPENRDKMLTMIEQMKKMGMASEDQIAQAKKMLGL